MADTTTPTTDTKNVLQSATIWGLIIAVAPTILKIFHVDLQPGWDNGLKELWAESQTVFGVLLAYWGRLRASAKLVVINKS